ncbi:uncharacterized protein LOC119091320 isoform X2 [Pollicipes pollicipes]|uniref:uncharacterized protein LOC119091320 isoform X2 n=1 Tax=Pollicipes pollicipes TaxID=41117 RepID=UPI0018853C16|nr:uncharacterized protein LOC119091320 isoform X2 [Pollicipes pollicipes]
MAHADFANCNGGTEGNTVVPTAPPQEGDHNYDPPPTYAEATGTIGGGGPVPGRLEAGLAPATMPALPTGPGFNDSPDPVRAAAATWAVTRTGGDGDAPPSYQSLFGQIKEAREKSTSICDFFATVFLMPLGFLVALVIFVLCVGVVFGMPVTLLAVGSYYMDDCPLEPGIPVWMVVGGALMLLHILSSQRKDTTCVDVMAVVAYLIWFIAGATLVYRNAWPNYSRANSYDMLYCGYTVYMTAFVSVSIISVLAVLICCVASI